MSFFLSPNSQIEFDTYTSRLYSFIPNSSNLLEIRDLGSDKYLGPHTISVMSIASFGNFKKFHQCVAIASSNQLYLNDFLVGTEPVIQTSFISDLFGVEISDQNIPVVSVCSIDSNISHVDIRYPEEKNNLLNLELW
jgi:hypothetical protein